jgi:polyhydroxybutyrate depolymerase
VRGIIAVLAVAILAALASVGLASSGRQAAPAAKAPAAGVQAVDTAACTPLSAGDHLLPAIDGRLPVLLHVPPRARAGQPLVLALPGAGQTAEDFAEYTGYSVLADRKGFTVAYPTATGKEPFWNMSGVVAGKPDDVAYLRRVIPAVVAAACADPARVGVTGVSNGGGMTARLACDAPDLIAAAAPVAGGYGSLPDCRPSQPVPVLEIHGTDDRVVPYAGKAPDGSGSVSAFLAQWRRLDACPSPATQRWPMHNVTELRWTGCKGGTMVVHDRITDAEHGWPGEDDLGQRPGFSSTLRTWRFLSAFRR